MQVFLCDMVDQNAISPADRGAEGGGDVGWGLCPLGLPLVGGGLEEAYLLALDDVDALEAVNDGLAGGYVELA